MSDAADIDARLVDIYNARGIPRLEVVADVVEFWLAAGESPKVNVLFDRLDLDRAEAGAGVLLLAMTRLTSDRFPRRAAFVDRLRAWLVGRDGRTEHDADRMLEGLRR